MSVLITMPFWCRRTPTSRVSVPRTVIYTPTISDTCAICLEGSNDKVTLECGHDFDFGCMVNLVRVNIRYSRETNCPLCRQPTRFTPPPKHEHNFKLLIHVTYLYALADLGLRKVMHRQPPYSRIEVLDFCYQRMNKWDDLGYIPDTYHRQLLPADADFQLLLDEYLHDHKVDILQRIKRSNVHPVWNELSITRTVSPDSRLGQYWYLLNNYLHDHTFPIDSHALRLARCVMDDTGIMPWPLGPLRHLCPSCRSASFADTKLFDSHVSNCVEQPFMHRPSDATLASSESEEVATLLE